VIRDPRSCVRPTAFQIWEHSLLLQQQMPQLVAPPPTAPARSVGKAFQLQAIVYRLGDGTEVGAKRVAPATMRQLVAPSAMPERSVWKAFQLQAIMYRKSWLGHGDKSGQTRLSWIDCHGHGLPRTSCWKCYRKIHLELYLAPRQRLVK
jgi:hypothetical protein